MVLVSVILPSYNHEEFISEAIESVLNQTFRDFEFIIIDDHSKDKSPEIIKKYQEKDNRIKACFHKENKGIARTQNECINMAKGKFIAFFNSDDVWDKNKLKKQLEVLEGDENLVVWTEGEIIDGQSKSLGMKFTQKFGGLRAKKSGNIFLNLLRGNFLFFSSIILKRENFENLRFTPQLRFHSDYKYESSLAEKYKFYFINEPLAKYRVHRDNTIDSDIEQIYKEKILIFEYFLMKYNDKIPKKIKWELYLDMCISYNILRSYNGSYKDLISSFLKAVKKKPFKIFNLILLVTFFSKIRYRIVNIPFKKIRILLKKIDHFLKK